MRNPYDVYVEYVREDVITVDASNPDEAMASVEEWAQEKAREGETVRVTGYSVNMEY